MDRFFRFCLRVVFRLCKVQVFGLKKGEKFPSQVIYLSNHLSTLDILILYAFLPNEPLFAVNKEDARQFKNRFFLKRRGLVYFQPLEPASVKTVMKRVEEGRSIVIFGEGRMSDEGGLLKIYEASGFIADKMKVPLVPVWIAGAEYSYFSPSQGGIPHRIFPRIRVTVSKPIAFKIKKENRKDRNYVSNELYRLLLDISFKAKYNPENSIFYELMKTAKINAKMGLFHRPDFVEDNMRVPHTYKMILMKSYMYGRAMKKYIKHQEHCGILLPNSIDNLTLFLGLVAYERVPTMFNFSSGVRNILSCANTASVKTVVTSSAFIKTFHLEPVIEALEAQGIKIVYLKEIKREIQGSNYFKAWFSYKTKRVPFKNSGRKKAVILFTSGSEGNPKAVVLSHQNILSNIFQMYAMVHLSARDTVFNALPMFHSFGLTVGTLYPLICGAKLFLYPSPLKYREISELVYEIGATIMFGTDTFLNGYARIGHPFDFAQMRFVMGGAEPVKKETRELWSERFGVRLFEGYGSTECAPIITVNNHIFCCFGSIGQIVPGMEYRLKKVSGIEEGGILEAKGPNVMMGYIYADEPGKIVPCKNGWYETGDVVEVDHMGFFFIRGRMKRFAKVAGEMISLTAVERLAEAVYGPGPVFGALAFPHETKGEQIVLVSTTRDAKVSDFVQYVQANGYSELSIPRTIVYREELPLIGSGKRDYITLKKDVAAELKL